MFGEQTAQFALRKTMFPIENHKIPWSVAPMGSNIVENYQKRGSLVSKGGGGLLTPQVFLKRAEMTATLMVLASLEKACRSNKK